MTPVDPPKRLADAMVAYGLDATVFEFPASTRTAQDAADAIGCAVEDIGKSLVFKGVTSGSPLLVIANGKARVDEDRIAELCGEPITKADAAMVREATGYAIGGVPPFGHASDIRTFIDAVLMSKSVIWVAAGTPKTVFSVDPEVLKGISGAEVYTG